MATGQSSPTKRRPGRPRKELSPELGATSDVTPSVLKDSNPISMEVKESKSTTLEEKDHAQKHSADNPVGRPTRQASVAATKVIREATATRPRQRNRAALDKKTIAQRTAQDRQSVRGSVVKALQDGRKSNVKGVKNLATAYDVGMLIVFGIKNDYIKATHSTPRPAMLHTTSQGSVSPKAKTAKVPLVQPKPQAEALNSQTTAQKKTVLVSISTDSAADHDKEEHSVQDIPLETTELKPRRKINNKRRGGGTWSLKRREAQNAKQAEKTLKRRRDDVDEIEDKGKVLDGTTAIKKPRTISNGAGEQSETTTQRSSRSGSRLQSDRRNDESFSPSAQLQIDKSGPLFHPDTSDSTTDHVSKGVLPKAQKDTKVLPPAGLENVIKGRRKTASKKQVSSKPAPKVQPKAARSGRSPKKPISKRGEAVPQDQSPKLEVPSKVPNSGSDLEGAERATDTLFAKGETPDKHLKPNTLDVVVNKKPPFLARATSEPPKPFTLHQPKGKTNLPTNATLRSSVGRSASLGPTEGQGQNSLPKLDVVPHITVDSTAVTDNNTDNYPSILASTTTGSRNEVSASEGMALKPIPKHRSPTTTGQGTGESSGTPYTATVALESEGEDSRSPLSSVPASTREGTHVASEEAEVQEQHERDTRDLELGICPLCSIRLSHLSLLDFRQHVERCMDEDEGSSFASTDKAVSSMRKTSPEATLDLELMITDLRNKLIREGKLPPAYEEDDEAKNPGHELSSGDAGQSSAFKTITSHAKFQSVLQNAAQESTPELYVITENIANVLHTWQDEWIELEERVAPMEHKAPRKPREPLNPLVFEDQKEAGLYGYQWNSHPSKIGNQEPWNQAIVGRIVGGRELRQRKPATKAAELEEDDAGAQPPKRRGRPPKATPSGAEEIREEVALTRASRRLAAKPLAQETLAAELHNDPNVPKKRGRPKLNTASVRLTDRETSATAGTSTEVTEGTPAPTAVKRRGRPPKNATQGPIASAPARKGSKRKAETPVEVDSEKPTKRVKSAKKSAAMKAWWSKKKADTSGAVPKNDDLPLSGEGFDGAFDTPFDSPTPSSRYLTPVPRKKGRPPGSRGKRGGRFSRMSERVVDSTAEDSDAHGPGDGLTEYDRFQRLANGELQEKLRRRERARPMIFMDVDETEVTSESEDTSSSEDTSDSEPAARDELEPADHTLTKTVEGDEMDTEEEGNSSDEY
ncbi:MAG: hypothetical protein M1837_001938 [Sclerophora amabilis]|nr:MAG: hypothetical protein M1837_001938 [Sclerophora amabilis]